MVVAHMMNKSKIILFCLCLLFTTTVGDGTQRGNSSEAITAGAVQNSKQTKCQPSENDERDCDIDYIINSNETGPLDSHEAMNTRELKARNKRSSEVDKKAFRNMLLGLVHKKSSRYHHQQPDMKGTATAADRHVASVVDDDADVEPQKFQSDASELLLELMVRIAAHPQQWDEVHNLLQKIDDDIMTSKKIITDLENTMDTDTTSVSSVGTTVSPNGDIESSTEVDEVQKLIILLDNEKHYQEQQKNKSRLSWPNLEDSSENMEEKLENYDQIEKERTATTQNIFPWSNKPSVKNTTREFEFAYHRVTGLPLPYRSNYDKTRARNAYIAVSVIAPKSRDVRLEKQDNLLEDELRQLKPWSHEENLSKMENIRKKWFIRSDPIPDKQIASDADVEDTAP